MPKSRHRSSPPECSGSTDGSRFCKPPGRVDESVERQFMRPDVRQQQLDQLFQTTTTVELADWVLNDEKRTLEPRVLLRFSVPEELEYLARLLRIQPRGNPSCTSSLGDCRLVFSPSDEHLTVQHGRYGLTLRAEQLWRYDAPLADGLGLVQYLQARGVEVLDYQTVQTGCYPVDPDLLDWESPPDPPKDSVLYSLEHLEQTISDPVELAESLLIWCAPASEVWDRYPGSRPHMRKMLQRLPLQVLLRALENPRTLGGAKALAEDWPEMPAKLRQRIRIL